MEKFINLFAEAIEVSKDEINPDTEIESLPTFDSLGIVTLIAMINQEYNKQIPADKIRVAKTVKELYALISD